MPDIPGNSSTTAIITIGGVANDTLETIGDHDWFRIELTAGQKITITVDGLTLEDSLVRILNSGGTVLGENDDISLGVVRDSQLVFTAPSTGTYYIDVGAFDDAYAGTYQLAVNLWTPPPVATLDTIAEHLTDGYWGGDRHRFNVTQGGVITYDFHDPADANGVTANGQSLAGDALALWSDIIGVTFVQVASGGQITFTDNEDGAFSEGTWSANGITSSMHVNVSTQWLTDYGTTMGSYGFQTYVHEIGHALGLGHGGYYNSTADYGVDAEFANDGWPTTVMSYFDQIDNTYFSGLGYTFAYVNTPMLADIRAMADLYGLSTMTRTGDTIYGFGNNSGRAAYDANLGIIRVYTIVDSGGTDTLNYSGFEANQTISLVAETFSNVGGGIGNVSIGYGTVIENAVGGSGNDVLNGNDATNVLTGNSGNDTISGAAGNDTLTGGAGIDILTGGAGNDIFRDSKSGLSGDTIVDFTTGDSIILTDASLAGFTFSLTGNTLTYSGGSLTLTGFTGQLTAAAAAGGGVELTVGSASYIGTAGDDVWNGTAADDAADGGLGNDLLDGLAGNDVLNGAGGNDTLVGGLGADVLDGGAGDDRIVYDAADNPAQVTGGPGTDTLVVSGSAAPTGFNLIAQGFERAEVVQTDAGGNPWSSITDVYNASWAMVQRVTVNDDNSRVVIDFDPNNLVSTTQVWSAFDSQGRLSSIDQIFDDGTRTFINLDEAANQSWVQDWFAYDAQGRLSSEDVLYDNGTRTFINIDEGGANPWAQDWFTYDAQGRLDSEDVHYDNGTRTFINLDQDNSQSWTQVWFTYDAQGRLDTQDVVNDDGSHVFYNYDQAGTEPFAVNAVIYNPNGTPYQQVTQWDDGSFTYTLL